MNKLFSTDYVPITTRFKTSQEWNREIFGPSNLRRLTDEAFEAHYASTTIASLNICEFKTSSVENKILPCHRSCKPDTMNINIVMSGSCHNEQLDNNALLQLNDLYITDNRYQRCCQYPSHASILSVTVSRQQLERLIGPSRLYAGLVIKGDLPGASLARNFFRELRSFHEKLSPGMAERLAAIGIDLITASVAERMAQGVPKPIQGTVIVQRAKAHIEANLANAELDPPHVAAAIGVSLRHLQQLFHDQGLHISQWIWSQRLARASRLLADPGRAHVPISSVAYGCGFTSLPHFSRQFRSSFNITPTEYRRQAKNSKIAKNSSYRDDRYASHHFLAWIAAAVAGVR